MSIQGVVMCSCVVIILVVEINTDFSVVVITVLFNHVLRVLGTMFAILGKYFILQYKFWWSSR
jgi:hypothetical protein